MSILDPYLARKATALAQRRADFTAQPEKATVRIQASSWVAGNTGARPVKLGDTLLVTDSAPALAGHGLGPTAPELLLGALASCLVHTYLIQAVLLQIPIDGVESLHRPAPAARDHLPGTALHRRQRARDRAHAPGRRRDLPGAQHPAPADRGHAPAVTMPQQEFFSI